MEFYIYDPPGTTGSECKCGEKSTFVLVVNQNGCHMCASCMAELAKRIIDALV